MSIFGEFEDEKCEKENKEKHQCVGFSDSPESWPPNRRIFDDSYEQSDLFFNSSQNRAHFKFHWNGHDCFLLWEESWRNVLASSAYMPPDFPYCQLFPH